MSGTSWDGVVPGGRIHRPRGRRASTGGAVDDLVAEMIARRPSAASARVRRVTPGRRGALRVACAALVLAVLLPAGASAGTAASGQAPAAVSSLEGRVRLLAAELQLTSEQQVKVRALLEQQREQVRQLWSDPTLPAALRVGRTQGISDRTVAEIRDLLDESQRRKYIQPRQREAAVGAGGADVQAWMDKGAGR